MNTLSNILQNSLEVIYKLVVDIGARPAGSPAEESAFQYVDEKLAGWGYDITHIPVNYAPIPTFYAAYLVGALFLVFSAALIDVFPWAAVFSPLIIIGLPQFTRWAIRQRKPTAQTQQSYAIHNSSDPGKPELLIVAHIDSARASAFENDRLLSLYDSGLYIAQRAAVAIAIVGFFSVAGLPIPPALLLVIGAAGILVGVGWMGMEVYSQIGKPVRYSPGAYDNASGVGVLMGLAEYFSINPTHKIQIGFLISSAEETGIHGASAYIQYRRQTANLAVLNLDMVGAGSQLQWVSQEGVFFPVKTDKILNRFISMADDSSSAIWYTRRSGDYLPFLEHHIPAASLQTSGHSSAERHYHTIKDGMKNIQTGSVDACLRTVVKFVELFERFGASEMFPAQK